ncbi:hypothetical protein [Intrasporangium sp. DVR]|uniref:hypothetical protein n=1 Tax=Intrasporangium sp. DVR TaxID=3127867 RepID=UPI00313A65D0
MTEYLPGRLLVAGFPCSDEAPWLVELREALGELGLSFRLTASSRRRISRLRATQGPALEILDAIWVSTAVLEPGAEPAGAVGTAGVVTDPPRAWWVIERLRSRRPALAARLSLVEARRPATMGAAPLGSAHGVGVPA